MKIQSTRSILSMILLGSLAACGGTVSGILGEPEPRGRFGDLSSSESSLNPSETMHPRQIPGREPGDREDINLNDQEAFNPDSSLRVAENRSDHSERDPDRSDGVTAEPLSIEKSADVHGTSSAREHRITKESVNESEARGRLESVPENLSETRENDEIDRHTDSHVETR